MVALLLTPIARWAFGACAVLAVLGGLYLWGRHDGKAACEARIAAAVAAEQLRQSAVRAKALDNAVARELAANAENDALEKKVADYEAGLATPVPEPKPGTAPADACGASRFKLRADDVRDLGVFQR